MNSKEFAQLVGVDLGTEPPPGCRRSTSMWDFLDYDPYLPLLRVRVGMPYYIRGKYGWEKYFLHPLTEYRLIKHYEIFIE